MRRKVTIQRYPDLEVVIVPIRDRYTYLLTWQKWAAAVDPVAAALVWRILRKRALDLLTILVTHPHADHMGGIAELKRLTHCTVLGPSRGRVPHQERNVREGDTLRLDSAVVRVLGTPGHGRVHVCYYVEPSTERPGLLWTGDTLLVGGCGRTMGAPSAWMWDSLRRLAALPDETHFFCGHERAVENYAFAAHLEPRRKEVRARLRWARARAWIGRPCVPGVLREEKITNPFLRASEPALKAALGMPAASDVEAFSELLRRREAFLQKLR